MTKICPECGTEQDESNIYCKHCGNTLNDENNNSNLNFSQNNSSENIENENKAQNNFNDMKICPKCGLKQEKISKFCRNCGARFSNENTNHNETTYITKCKHCGAELNKEMYCPDCGEPTGIKICPKCKQKIVNEDFCTTCGYKINKSVKNCNNCGSKMDSKAKVCPHCGAQVVYKNPIVALALSFIICGLGQFYNNQNRKGITLIISTLISIILCFIIIGIIPYILLWIYGMYDAFVSANAMNKGEFVEDKIF